MEEYDDSHLRNKEVGIIYEVVYNNKDYLAYQNIDGKWVIYKPLDEDHERIIKPTHIGRKKQFMSKLSIDSYKKSRN